MEWFGVPQSYFWRTDGSRYPQPNESAVTMRRIPIGFETVMGLLFGEDWYRTEIEDCFYDRQFDQAETARGFSFSTRVILY